MTFEEFRESCKKHNELVEEFYSAPKSLRKPIEKEMRKNSQELHNYLKEYENVFLVDEYLLEQRIKAFFKNSANINVQFVTRNNSLILDLGNGDKVVFGSYKFFNDIGWVDLGKLLDANSTFWHSRNVVLSYNGFESLLWDIVKENLKYEAKKTQLL